MKFLWQSSLLLLSFGFIFLWQNTPLASYTVQIFGFLIFLFLLVSARKKNFNPLNAGGGFSSVFILNAIIFLFVFSTGGLSSPLFFLLYFLIFGIAFIFTPATAFVFLLGTVLILLPDTLKNNVTENLLKVGSLALISPLAFFFGKEFKQEEKSK